MVLPKSYRAFACVTALALAALACTAFAPGARAETHMTLVGTLAPWSAGQYSNVAADATRGVAYMGSWDDQGVAVIDTRDPAHPVLTQRFPTRPADSADLDLVGRYLAVSHQDLTFTDPPGGFEGISVYDTQADPRHPVLLRRIAVPGGVHTVQLDPEVESGRPYAYANSGGNLKMTIVNILTGETLSQFASTEGIGCIPPPPSPCYGLNYAHEGFIQRHPRSGRVLDYVSYWDSGLRIVDVSDPRAPVEVGSLDYNIFTNGLRSAHYAAPTPSGDWVYLEDEIGYVRAGGVHILNTSGCDGTAYCTPVIVGGWDLPGRDVQTASIHKFFHHLNVNGSSIPITDRSFIYDAHNLDRRGENTLLVANYGMGIRMIDTSDKTAPFETAFYLPNSNMSVACKMDCGIVGRQTWGSYFGSDGLIYASDFTLGFFIVDPAGRTGATGAAAGLASMGAGGGKAGLAAGRPGVAGSRALRVVRTPGGFEISFAGTVKAPVRGTVFDVSGRQVARLTSGADGAASSGGSRLVWNGRDASGRAAARGVYLIRAESGSARGTVKVAYLGE